MTFNCNIDDYDNAASPSHLKTGHDSIWKVLSDNASINPPIN